MIKIFVVDDFIIIGRKKFYLNLNDYRGSHFQVLNKAKIKFKENLYLEYPEIKKLKFKKLEVSYSITPTDKRLFDTMNIISIVDKFFLDALVEAEMIPDDNYKVVSYGTLKTIEPEKSNKRKKIIITCKGE
jgi:hypothetical protein